MDRTTAVTSVIVALISAGLLTYFKDATHAWRTRRAAGTTEAREAMHVATADKSLLVVARARDELAEDNDRLRVIIAEDRRRHAEDRMRWDEEKKTMREEIESLEAKLRAILREVEELKSRHAE